MRTKTAEARSIQAPLARRRAPCGPLGWLTSANALARELGTVVQAFYTRVSMASGPPTSEAPAGLDALRVVLPLKRGPVSGEVLSLDITNVVVEFVSLDPPTLPLGVVVPLEFTTSSLRQAVRLHALVVSRTEEQTRRRYTFQFKLKEGQDPGDLIRLFNRRSSFRTSMERPVVVHVRSADAPGQSRGAVVACELHDISATGLALVVTPEQDMKLGSDRIEVEFELPSVDKPLKALATVRYRVLNQSSAIRYGCAFDPASSGFASTQQIVLRYLMRRQQERLRSRGQAD